jgi:hypothetical protein
MTGEENVVVLLLRAGADPTLRTFVYDELCPLAMRCASD